MKTQVLKTRVSKTIIFLAIGIGIGAGFVITYKKIQANFEEKLLKEVTKIVQKEIDEYNSTLWDQDDLNFDKEEKIEWEDAPDALDEPLAIDIHMTPNNSQR